VSDSLAHSYTNTCWIVDDRFHKRYEGADALQRMRVELEALERATGRVPVPAVLDCDERRREVTFARVAGENGQDLIERGCAESALAAAGRTLRALHPSAGPTLVHGDYGPQNLLHDPARCEVVAVVDWEFAHLGDSVDDLAWAEWIVRMHHPAAVGAVTELLAAYGSDPGWKTRHASMIASCRRLRLRGERFGDAAAATLWAGREAVTASWQPDPSV
jgi:aminoglycoside phosphotransferase (APT) family kinase protein